MIVTHSVQVRVIVWINHLAEVSLASHFLVLSLLRITSVLWKLIQASLRVVIHLVLLLEVMTVRCRLILIMLLTWVLVVASRCVVVKTPSVVVTLVVVRSVNKFRRITRLVVILSRC